MQHYYLGQIKPRLFRSMHQGCQVQVKKNAKQLVKKCQIASKNAKQAETG